MDGARGTGKDHQPAKNSHREDRHEESLTDRDPSHEYEEDSEQQKPPPVVLDPIQSGQRNCASDHLFGLLVKWKSKTINPLSPAQGRIFLKRPAINTPRFLQLPSRDECPNAH